MSKKENAMVKNAADPEQVKKATQKVELREELEVADLRHVMNTDAGRRFLWRLVSECGIYKTSFTGNSHTFFNEGMRNVGLLMYKKMIDASPEAFLLMQKKTKKERRMSEEEAVTDTPTTAESESQNPADKLYADTDSKDEAKVDEEPEGKPETKEESKESEESDDSEEAESSDDTEEKESEESDEEKSETKKSKAPDKYDFQVDDDSPLTDEHLGKIASYAKKQGLPNDEAQKLVDLQEESLKSYRSKLDTDFKKTAEGWKTACEKDPEIGGDDFGKNVQFAKNALDKFGNDVLREELVTTGFANHPELVRVFARIGKAMDAGPLVLGGKEVSTPKTREAIFYPNDN